MILTDFDGHTDSVMIPILDWLRVNQSELLVNMDKSAEGLKFEADMLDRSKVDLSLTLPLTERVIVTRRGGGVVESGAQVDLNAQKRGRKGPFLLPVIPKVFPKRSHLRVQRWRTSMKSSTCVAEA